MLPALWTALAALLLVFGLFGEWSAPRQRTGRLLNLSVELREGRWPTSDVSYARTLSKWIFARLRRWLPSGQLGELRERLLWAGQPLGLSAEEFYTVKICGSLGVGALCFGLSGSLGYGFIGLALSYLVPDKLLEQRIEERSRQIRVDLPQFTHLWATALEAGLPITEAARRIALEVPGLLGAEMLRSVHEIAAGKPAPAAWQHLSARTRCVELQETVAAVIQAQELGVPVANQLRFQMRTIRARKQQQAKERAEAASVKMRIPTVLLIMMPTLVILLGPAAVAVLRQLRGM